MTKTTGAETRAAAREAHMTESTGYRLNYPAVDYDDGQTEKARWAMEQLHGTVNAAVKDENDAQEPLSRFRNIMEAATHVADTLCQGNPEMGPLMVQELDRMEETLIHRAVSETATQSGDEISHHSTAMLEEISRHMDKSRQILEELTPRDPLA